jgi:hypothetical protein
MASNSGVRCKQVLLEEGADAVIESADIAVDSLFREIAAVDHLSAKPHSGQALGLEPASFPDLFQNGTLGS